MVLTQQCVCIHVCVHIYSNVLKSWPFTKLIVDQWTMYIRREEGSKKTNSDTVCTTGALHEGTMAEHKRHSLDAAQYTLVLHSIIRFIIQVIVFVE